MPLLTLPPEILYIIFRRVGSAYFQEDTRRMLVSRKWYTFAQPIILESLVLRNRKLRQWRAASPHTWSTAHSRTKNLDVHLVVFGERGHHYHHHPTRVQNQELQQKTAMPQSSNWLANWTKNTDAALSSLADRVDGFQRLTSFSLHALVYNEVDATHGGLDKPLRYYLSEPTVMRLLERLPVGREVGRFLDRLTLDIAGAHLIQMRGAGDSHLCPLLARRIPAVRHVRIRMQRICADLFSLIPLASSIEDYQSTNDRNRVEASRTRSLIINTIVEQEDRKGVRTAAAAGGQQVRLPNSCADRSCGRALVQELQTAFRPEGFPVLQVARIPYQDLQQPRGLGLYELDLLSGKTTRLSAGSAVWDVDIDRMDGPR